MIKTKQPIWLYWDYNKPSLVRIFNVLLKNNNPNTTIHFLDRDTVKTYVKEYPKYFTNLCPAHQADYIRVYLLNNYGGLWLDSDVLCIDNLDEFLYNIDTYGLTLMCETESTLCNSLIGATKGHPFIKLWLERMYKIIEDKKGDIQWCDIGGKLMMDIYINNMELSKNCYIYLAYKTFYNISWQDCKGTLLTRDVSEFKDFYKSGQLLLITVNSLYNELKNKSARDILKNTKCILYKYLEKACKSNFKNITLAMTIADLDHCIKDNIYKDKLCNMPPIFYCNLDRHNTRNTYMIDHLTKYNITNYTRISGYDGGKDKSFYIPSSICKYESDNIPAVYGCTASHIKAIKEFYYNSDYNAAIIMEDDISFEYVEYWKKSFNSMLDKLPWDYDCCLLEYIKVNEHNISLDIQKYKYGEYLGTCAYLISRKGASKLLDSLKYKGDILDFTGCEHVAADWYIYGKMENVYTIPLITYVADNSTIHPDHVDYHKAKKDIITRLWQATCN